MAAAQKEARPSRNSLKVKSKSLNSLAVAQVDRTRKNGCLDRQDGCPAGYRSLVPKTASLLGKARPQIYRAGQGFCADAGGDSSRHKDLGCPLRDSDLNLRWPAQRAAKVEQAISLPTLYIQRRKVGVG